MPFEFGNPHGLWLLGLLAPLLLLYVLKVRRPRVRVGSTWLWQAALRDLSAEHPWQKLRRQLLLLLEALAIVLFALSLARPTLRHPHFDDEHLALVIDVSASMLTENAAGESRFEAARSAAARVLALLSPGADVLLIEAGAEPRVIAPADRDLSRVKSQLATLRAAGLEGHLERAVALASQQLAQRGGTRRIVVVSDDGGLSRPLPSTTVPVTVVRVGEATDNTGIIRLDVGRREDRERRADRVEVFAEVANFAGRARDVFVTLTPRNSKTVLASRKLHLQPGEKAPVLLDFEAAGGDAGMGVVVELAPPDQLPIDDRAYGRVPPSRKLTAVLSPPHASPWLERALLADPDLELFGVPLAQLSSSAISEDALVLVSGACPSNLPGTDFVIMNPPPGACYEAVVGGVLTAPTLTSWERTDPRLRFISFDGLAIAKARALEPPLAQGALVRAREGTVIADVSQGGRTGTLLGFDVGESTWPLRASFVLFVRNLAEIARQHRESRVVGPARSGSPLRLRVPAWVGKLSLTLPSGEKTELEAKAGLAILPTPRDPGFYLATYSEGGEQEPHRAGSSLSVVNLTSALESNLQLAPSTEAPSPVTAAAAAKVVEGVGDLGWLVAALAFLVLLLLLGLLTRRPRAVLTANVVARLPQRIAGAKP